MKKWTKFQWLFLLPLSGLYRWKMEQFKIIVNINGEDTELICWFRTCKFTNTHQKWMGVKFGEWKIVSEAIYQGCKNNENINVKVITK